MAEERSFKASKRKLDRARREGKVLRGKFVATLAVWMAMFGLIWTHGAAIWVAPKMLLQYSFADQDSDIVAAVFYAKTVAFQTVATVLGICALAGLGIELLQVGFRMEAAPLSPQFERLNPATGLKRMLTSVRQLWEPLLRVAILGCTAGIVLWNAAPLLAHAQSSGAAATLAASDKFLLKLALTLLGAAAAVAAFDYFLQRRNFNRELSMSHAELREELKDTEGAPLMKAMRRAMHESIAMQNLAQRVRQAKVVVVRKARRK